MAASEQVVLVHGLWMHGAVMSWMGWRIARAGYTVHRYTYPSMRMSLVENARRLAAFCQALGARPLHLVGHSLGGMLIARMLDEPHRIDVGRVVFMGSPFADSFAAHRLSRVRMARAALGASIGEWMRGTPPASMARYDIGVIAGNRGVGLGMVVARGLPAPHDGTVSVAETVVPGAKDHIELKVSHTEMIMSMQVARQVCEYLRRGRFARA
jgi:pimeloyl-ACP methyl ester carboxylesterase